MLTQQGPLQVDDACSLAALDALSFDADQARAAEWYVAHPNVSYAIPDSAVHRAASFFTPPPLESDDACGRTAGAQRMLRRMDAEALSAYSAVVYAALGSGRAAMSAIADIAKREIDWQLALQRPMYTVLRPAPLSAAGATAGNKVVRPWTRNFSPAPDSDRKRKRRAPEAQGVPETPSPHKRSRLASGAYHCVVSDRSATPPPADSRNEAVDEDAPAHHRRGGGRLWERLALGLRDDPPPSELSEEQSTAAVRHAREEAPEFGAACVPVRLCGDERRNRVENPALRLGLDEVRTAGSNASLD